MIQDDSGHGIEMNAEETEYIPVSNPSPYIPQEPISVREGNVEGRPWPYWHRSGMIQDESGKDRGMNPYKTEHLPVTIPYPNSLKETTPTATPNPKLRPR